jgi:hypothetical protein
VLGKEQRRLAGGWVVIGDVDQQRRIYRGPGATAGAAYTVQIAGTDVCCQVGPRSQIDDEPDAELEGLSTLQTGKTAGLCQRDI